MAFGPNPPRIQAHICVKGGEAALAFYEQAFGAKTAFKHMADDQARVLHANIELFGGEVMLHDDDYIHSVFFYWGIGGITAAMTGMDPSHFDNETSWLEPNLEWESIERLRFDADNKWLQFAVNVNKALWRYWEEDYHMLPYLHRSPLDAAVGIRGSELFMEMYSEPDKVRKLCRWCPILYWCW